MPDSESYEAIHEIKSELAAQGGILRTLLFVTGAQTTETIVAELRQDAVLAQVFLLVNGLRTQRDIVTVLRDIRGGSQQNISRKMSRLQNDLALIEPTGRAPGGGGVVFRRTPSAEAFRIRQALEAVGVRAIPARGTGPT